MKKPLITAEYELDGADLPTVDLTPEMGSAPLANPKWENFVQAVYRGESQAHAYRTYVSVKKDPSRLTVDTESSRLMKKDVVQARFRYLVRVRKPVDGDEEPEDPGTDPASRREVVIQTTRIIRSRQPAVIKLQAIDRLIKLNQWDKVAQEDPTRKAPDPAFFAAYVHRMRAQLGKTTLPPAPEPGSK